ncbi:hypothetical protein ABB37_09122 [Leptomonas pyrrhocoris]|uniref:Uncharacterized protein n=1 Tax=Leptomonas pyrrhocoris TaxID=157538 RepID=A0A0M9FRC0_LEPPY|nr:hypothetical protein ABB37_09122 [Leptomonas pyrrhocoris]XP_015652865.1 hypothetical protein ABB37_09122 [Leptomonas pyrrhocoris]XP_015652866.1 hypothetical protein ABB37_09122 [Leptomonas pyrrhocoris]KPA74425.1 hypothetical protein ABB37_09122 [Leptomonas pyrrhocoris]KPA74426.1 hypothetical protein ABB37_09122 [Leptomonas pyrrhocoris]KPA74427.1 hypothetical protein ABB37_09122 [Leptomonas pyrrhocoris]|eukprot:XP_015652864.1 hypothetical protein ABB37_09122 [Leptomonas pyrrhocoris]
MVDAPQGMLQFVVQKSNNSSELMWSTRVLTVDVANHILYLSQRRNVSHIEHHVMVAIKEVKWWPHYSWFFHSNAYILGDSELTFCVKGSTLHSDTASPFSYILHPRTRRITAQEHSALERSAAAMVRGFPVNNITPSSKVHCSDVWMLRCMTREDMEPLLVAFQSAVMNPGSVKGTVHVAPPICGEEPVGESAETARLNAR